MLPPRAGAGSTMIKHPMSDKDDKGDKDIKRAAPQAGASVSVPNIKKRGLKGFWRDVQREMRHVTWPTRAETTRLTGVVLAVCAIAILLLTALSIGFETIFDLILRRN